MRKRIVSLLLSLALCLTLLPTAAFAEEAQPEEPIPGEQLEQVQPVQEEPEENEEQSQQDEDVIAVQALINALPDASELDEMDAEALESACLAASEAYEAYDALTEEQQSALTGVDNMLDILEWATRQVTPLDDTTTGTEHQSHPICGAKCTHTGSDTHSGVTWTPVSSLDQIKTKGNYYLTDNVTLSKTWQCSKDVNLCLNDKSITANGNFDCIEVTSSSYTLTLCDCQGGGCITHSSGKTGHGVNTSGKFIMYGGTISGNTAEANDVGGGGVIVRDRFTMNGGTISGNKTAGSTFGGGVYVASGKTFTMNGGEITQNTSDNGGGVHVVSRGNFNMNSGTITGNTADNSGGGVCSVGTFKMTGGTIGGADNAANKAKNGGGVYVGSGSTFEMSGGEITDNTASGYGDGGGVYVNYDGTFQMSDGSRITGNTGYRGGGVSVERSYSKTNNPGAFTMSSGRITDNNAQYGGGVYISGNFTMSGGEISSNQATGNSGGVHMNTDSTFTVSGAPKITGNTLKNGTTNNVRLSKGTTTATSPKPDATITIGDAHLSTGASIGVTTDKTLTTGSSVTIATGAISGDEKYFTSDADRDYHFVLDGNEVKLGQHQHNWTYALSTTTTANDTITAKCTAKGCSLADGLGGSVTISAPTGTLIYDGKPKEVTLDSTLDSSITKPKIMYQQGEAVLNTDPPTDAGTYTASITRGGVTASVEYTIAKAEAKVDDFTFTRPANLTYDGNAKTAEVTAKDGIKGMGEITVKYFKGGSEVSEAKDVGEYTVKISVAEGGKNYNAAIDLTADDWKFAIKANNGEPTVELPANTTYTYNGQQITPEVVVKIGNKPLVKGNDYTVTYGDNTNAGKNAGSVTVKAAGSYGFAEKTVNFTIGKKTLSASDLEFTGAAITKVYDKTDKCENATVQIKASAKLNENDKLPTVSGSYVYDSANVKDASKVTFTSQKTESENYILPAGLKVQHAAKIIKAKQAPLTVTSTTATYGTDLTLTTKGGSGDGAVTYTVTNGTDAATIVDGGTLHPTKAGTVTVTATKSGGDNYEDVTSAEKEINIAKAIYTGTASKTVNIVKGLTTAQTGTLTAADFFLEGQMPAGAKITAWSLTSHPTAILSAVSVDGGKLTYLSAKNIATASEESGTVTIAATNYKDIEAKLTFHPTDKLAQDGFKFENGRVTRTYGDPDFTLAAAGAAAGSIVTYESSDQTVATVDANGKVTILKAGGTVITAMAAETAAYEQATATYTLTVEKKTVTVKAKDQTAYVGDKVPALGADSYTVSGLVGGDTLTTQPTAKYVDAVGKETTPDTTKTGETIIRASGAVASDNYTIRYEDGKLTVSTRPSGGGGSRPSTHPVKAEVSKDPDGSVSLSKTNAAKGDKVTVTVKPDRHYEVDEVIVRDSKGKQLAVKDNGDGTFTFEMPADKVTVEPTFSWVNPFADVADSAYYVDAVEWMLKREVTQGTTETTFSPNLNCTRAQIVTFLWRAAGSPEPKGTVGFADVSAGSYYAKAVAWAIENGITGGTGDGLFSPDATCTRAQSAAFLYRAAGSPAVGGSAGFSDVAADAYYAQAVAWAKEHGITDGIGGGLFGSDNDCTRAQIAAFLWRLYAEK